MEHEGALITAGEKHIITLNLWAMQKNTADDERIVHVTFPSVVPSPAPDQDAGRGKRQRTDKEDAQSHAAALRSALNDQSYAISVAALAILFQTHPQPTQIRSKPAKLSWEMSGTYLPLKHVKA